MSRTPAILALLALIAVAPCRGTQAPVPHYQLAQHWPQPGDCPAQGAVAGVGVNARGQVLVFHRAGRRWPASDIFDTTPIPQATVCVLDAATGAVLARWGAGRFAMPHGLSVDAQDNIWLTDIALQQVYKYSADGHLLLTLGERGVAGQDTGHFDRPTAVAVAADGSFYVADGYRNARIMKFSPAGTFLLQWGSKGSGPGQFHLPHAIALDEAGHVHVADRQNRRIQVFDADGHYLRQWHGAALGTPFALAFATDGPARRAYVADGANAAARPASSSAWLLLDADGTVRERIGATGPPAQRLRQAHSIAVARDGTVYIGDILGAGVRKFTVTPAAGEPRP